MQTLSEGNNHDSVELHINHIYLDSLLLNRQFAIRYRSFSPLNGHLVAAAQRLNPGS